MSLCSYDGIYTADRGWLCPGTMSLDGQGRIVSIEPGLASSSKKIAGYLIPAFQNAHSHAFQYAMAGLAENLSPQKPEDDFWSWRSRMYEIALSISPEELENIATQLYRRLREKGYSHLAEFHYLHHDPKGKPYANRGEMMERLTAAAVSADMAITLVPVFYQRGGFGQEAAPEQRRFISATLDDYWKLVDAAETLAKRYDHVRAGCGVHSLRAADPQDVLKIFDQAPACLPLHIHVAEQKAEVEQSLQVLGARPVRWLLDHARISKRCHLVHATHVDAEEVRDLAQSGASVVLCPSTEGNLGDGLFPLRDYSAAGGRFSIGSDSQVGLSPLEELRWLEYGQRLFTQKRDILCTPQQPDSGRILFDQAQRAGRAAMGLKPEWFIPGETLRALVVQPKHYREVSADHLLSALIFSGDETWLKTSRHSVYDCESPA